MANFLHLEKEPGIGWKITSLLLIYLVLAALCNMAWRLLHLPPQMRHGVLDPVLMLLTGLILVGSILSASALTLHLFENRPLETVGVPLSGPWLQQLCIGLLVGGVTPILFFLFAYESGHAQILHMPLDLRHVLSQTLPALVSMLLLAFNEELLFRGYIMQLIAQRSGPWSAALITGTLFGLAHGVNSAANPQGLIFTGIGGVLLAWLVMRNGSLWMAGGYHAGWNATASLVLGLGVSGTISPGSWISTTLTGPRWLSGGSYGFESSVIAGIAEPIVLGCLVWLAPRLPSHSVSCYRPIQAHIAPEV